MSRVNDQNDKDLEKGLETRTKTSEEDCDEEKIQLLEDRSAGKLIYFFSPYFFELLWILNIFISLIGTGLAFSTQALYFALRNFYYDSQTKISECFSPLGLIWLISNYLLYFSMVFVTYIYDKNNVIINTNALQKLLEEVVEIDLMSDPEAWRRIAFRINQCSEKKRYNSFMFYKGEQCRWFFVREIVKPIESGSYDIRCCYDRERCRNYFQNPSNKNLAEKAVATYKKSVETFGELLDMDEKNNRSDRLFEKVQSITMNAALYLGGMELGVIFFTELALLMLSSYCAIFH